MLQTDRETKLNDSWNANAGAWTNVIRTKAIRSRNVGTDAAIVNAVVRLTPQRALDVGCGEGWLTRALTARGIETIGMDGSAGLIESARTEGGGTFQTLSYQEIVANPQQLDAPYDAIVCNFSLLGQDLVPLLNALKTALASDGSLLVQTVHPWIACGDAPYVEGWRDENFAAFGNEKWQPMPWYFRTLQTWMELVRDAGFQVNRLLEPLDPETNRPLSLLLVLQRAPL